MTGYPDGPLDARLELMLGAWTDITGAAMPDGVQSASVRSGQSATAQQPQPAALSTAFDNDTGTFSPRNQVGPYYGLWRQGTPARLSVGSPYGTYLRVEAGDSDRAYVDDTAALHVTGSLEVSLELRLSDWQGCVLAARWDNTQPSWFFRLNPDGTLTFTWCDPAGSQHAVTSGAQLPYTSGIFAVAARLDLDALTLGFYTSDGIDGTFTLLEDSPVAAGSVRAGNAPLVAGWSGNGIGAQLLGMVTQCRLYAGATVVADADFASRAPGSSSWTDGQGLTWNVAGGALVTDRDYALHAEASSIAPQALTAGGKKAVVQLGGRLRRLQQPSAPAADSPMKRAILGQQGDLYPVWYAPMEDGTASTLFGPAVGTSLLTSSSPVKPAADSTFEASAPLPQLNGGSLRAVIPAYAGATAAAVRFLVKVPTFPSGADVAAIAIILFSGGPLTQISVYMNSSGEISMIGFDGSTQKLATSYVSWPGIDAGLWMSIEGVPVAGGVQYSLVSVAPGLTTGSAVTETLAGPSVAPVVNAVEFNGVTPTMTDLVIGHVSVQKAVTTIFEFGQPLNAWRGERAAPRFARMCADNGIPCRILGSPAQTQPMGPQPRGSLWQVLRDCAWTEQGIPFEPADSFSLGLRTRASMTGQLPAVTLSFDERNLPGSMQAADDDAGLLNDITASMPDGTQVRVVLDDGSPRSVSAAGHYVGQPPMPFNTADADGLANVAAFYLTTTAVDEAKYRQVAAHFGVPGAPARDMALTRPGDLIVLEVPAPASALTDGSGDMILDGSGAPLTDGSTPAGEAAQAYQTGDIRQLWTGATTVLGPGRAVTWDCVPASPWHPVDLSTVTGAILDTFGGELLDTDGNPILDTGA